MMFTQKDCFSSLTCFLLLIKLGWSKNLKQLGNILLSCLSFIMKFVCKFNYKALFKESPVFPYLLKSIVFFFVNTLVEAILFISSFSQITLSSLSKLASFGI